MSAPRAIFSNENYSDNSDRSIDCVPSGVTRENSDGTDDRSSPTGQDNMVNISQFSPYTVHVPVNNSSADANIVPGLHLSDISSDTYDNWNHSFREHAFEEWLQAKK